MMSHTVSDKRLMPRVQLAHYAGDREYVLHDIPVRRRRDEMTVVRLTCETCGEKVRCTVAGDQVRRNRCALRMIVALVRFSVCVMPFVAVGSILLAYDVPVGAYIPFFYCSFVLLMLPTVAIFGDGGIWEAYSGVEIEPSPGHSIRRRGNTKDPLPAPPRTDWDIE